jgi:hypothetical protein
MVSVSASENDILCCQFHQWYPRFEKSTIRSDFIPLDAGFLNYLCEDGIKLPRDLVKTSYGNDYLSDDDELRSVESVSDYPATHLDSDTISKIELFLSKMTSGVFVKLNWSAPLDASWLFGGSLCCKSVEDILLLLKSSDRITFDVDHMFLSCPNPKSTRIETPYLVLRKWANLTPSMEFRIFVWHGQITGQ